MPFPRQTLSQLRKAVAADISAALPGDVGNLRFSPTRILGDVLAALTNLLYGYLDWIARQAVPYTATDEHLEGWAGLKGITRKAATAATASVNFAGANGAVLPAGTPATRADGVKLITTASGTITGGSVSVPVAVVDAGAAGNAPAGASVALAVGIQGIAPTGVTLSDFSGGADAEMDGPLRTRMLAAYAAPAQGGAAADYEAWALAVPGVTRAWAKGNGMGAGTVAVFFMMDEAEAAHGGFPQGTNGVAAAETRAVPATGDQLAVADAILPLQPVTALVYAVAPAANTLVFTIAGIAPSAATKAAIEAAIAGAIARDSSPGGSTAMSAIEFAIASLPAAAGFVITNIAASAGTVSPGAAGNITANPGCLSVFGAVIWA